MRLAQIKKKQVKVSTGTVNTGVTVSWCMYSLPVLKLTGYKMDDKTNAIEIRDMISSIEQTLPKMKDTENCWQLYSDYYTQYAANKSYLVWLRDNFTSNWNNKLSQQIYSIQLDIDIIFLDEVNLNEKWNKWLFFFDCSFIYISLGPLFTAYSPI